jgi:SAM-dependent methyltransferase
MADLKESSLFHSLEDQKKHWYYYHKVRIIRNLLDRHLLNRVSVQARGSSAEVRPLRCMDIGAGNGIISRSLGSSIRGKSVSWDLIDSEYSPRVLGQDPIDPSIVLYAAIPEGAVYDVIIAIDVVEHIENDRAFVDQLARHLSRDGLIVICVPAFQFLWSNHDVFLEHYRRYRRRDLVLMMRREGLQVVASGYLYVLLFPLIALIRLFGYLRGDGMNNNQDALGSDLKVYPEVVNRLLRGVMGFELTLLHLFPWLGKSFGVSCVAVGVQASASGSAASSMTSRRM